jgi:hypothetical protein
MLTRKISAILLIILVLGSGLLSACDAIPDPAAARVRTPTPTATPDPLGYQAIADQSCQVSNWATIQAEQRIGGQTHWLQGDLIAWQPGSHNSGGNLAYLTPDDRSSWFTGRLMLARGPEFTEPISLAPNVLVSGDLTWSPDGSWLAFLAFRPNEGIYTIMVVRSDGSRLTDLFPTDLAQTDMRASQKAVIGWKDNNTVQVIASCGEQCRFAYDLSVSEPPGPILNPTPVMDYHELNRNLEISTNILEHTPEDFPRGVRTPPPPKWSPDTDQVIYLDRRGLLWLLLPEAKNNYLIDVGLRDVYEAQWSPDSKKLAVRAEDRIFVFETPCLR